MGKKWKFQRATCRQVFFFLSLFFFEVKLCVLKNNLNPGLRTLDPVRSIVPDSVLSL